MKDFLDIGALKLFCIFERERAQVYAVGGCVRDSIMDRRVSDVDLAVSVPPDVTIEILRKYGIRYVETGIAHGTVTAILSGNAYEITSFRTDGEYSDNRRPDRVKYISDIITDLSRRDYTINAIAYNPKDGIIDIFDGRDDITNKIIRTVGEPDLRFKEDALRILRGLRFASVLDFKIEAKTSASMLKNASLLRNIARERITDELIKLLRGVGAARIISEYREIIHSVSPEFSMLAANGTWENAVKCFDKLPQIAQLRLAALILFLSGSVDVSAKIVKSVNSLNIDFVNKVLGSLRLKNKTAGNIRTIVMNCSTPEPGNLAAVKRILSRLGIELYSDILILRAAVFFSLKDSTAQNRAEQTLEMVEIINQNHDVFNKSGLDISGNDLKYIGLEGAEIGEKLNLVLDKVIEGTLENDREKIISFLLNNI